MYIEDIVLYSKNEEEHKKLLEEVLNRLYNKDVRINFEKSKFFTTELDILGYKVKEDGIYPKINYLENNIFNKEIRTKKDLQKLLGILNWYRKFIPNLSRRIFKISEQLKNNIKSIKINQDMKKQIKEIIEFIKNNAKISFPDYSKKFILQCDALEIGIGAVLKQEDRIIGYFSKKLQGSELNYTIVEKEYLAVLLSMLHFKQIIQGNYIEVQSDSNNILYEAKVKTSRINRWKLLMNDFDYEIIHIKGELNVIADGLSRCFFSKTQTVKEESDMFIQDCCQRSKETKELITDKRGRIVVKNRKIKLFLKYLHEKFGHRGMSTIYNNIKDFYYVAGIIKNIKKIINSCRVCNKYKIHTRKVNPIKMTSKKIFERVSTDIYGPFKLNDFKTDSCEETGYILSITDIYSRYTSVYFYERITSKEVIKSFDNWIEELETVPEIIIADNGRQYNCEVFKNYMSDKNIIPLFIPEYTPSSNGISERINKTISFILSISKGKALNNILVNIKKCLNLNYNRSIQNSPYSIRYGINFFDIKKRKLKIREEENQGIGIHRFKVDDYVLKKDPKAKKLDRKFGNRRLIKKVGSKGMWVLLDSDKGWTHIRNLKPCWKR